MNKIWRDTKLKFSITAAKRWCCSANKVDDPSKTQGRRWEWSHYQTQSDRTQPEIFLRHFNKIQDFDAFTPDWTVEEDLSATVGGGREEGRGDSGILVRIVHHPAGREVMFSSGGKREEGRWHFSYDIYDISQCRTRADCYLDNKSHLWSGQQIPVEIDFVKVEESKKC